MKFRPRLIPSIVTLLILPVLLWLAFWQLDRAEQKQMLQQSFDQKSELAPVAITELDLTAPDVVHYRRVTMDGHYINEPQILLDNQVNNGRAGYHVYTPFKVNGLDTVILVNRGWIALGESRQVLPDIAITADHTDTSINGRISQPANPGLLLDAVSNRQIKAPYVVQHIDYEYISQLLGRPLAPVVVLLDAELAQGYERDWQPTFSGFGPQRHIGYAVQWFALALTLIILYLVMNTQWQRQT